MDTKTDNTVRAEEHTEAGIFTQISESLASAWGRVALGIVGVSMVLGSMGCSPKDKSRFFGEMAPMPDPPAAARLQTGVSTETNGDLFINYVMWNANTKQFERHDIHYTFYDPLNPIPRDDFRQAGGYTQLIKDGEVLSGGVIVDQQNGVLILPGGNKLDGPSGAVISPAGDTVKTLAH